MPITTARVTLADYRAGDYPRSSQLVRGEVIVNEPGIDHQRVAARLLARLLAWRAGPGGSGEVGFGGNWVLSEDTVAVPDVWWVADEHRPAPGTVWMQGGPDLAVEVRSLATWRYDVGPKRVANVVAGTTELWAVDTASRSILFYRGPGLAPAVELEADDELSTPLLRGLRLCVREAFEP